MSEKRTATPILWQAIHILSQEINSEDGVANASLSEAAMRLEELYYENQVLQMKIESLESKVDE